MRVRWVVCFSGVIILVKMWRVESGRLGREAEEWLDERECGRGRGREGESVVRAIGPGEDVGEAPGADFGFGGFAGG